MTTLAEDFREKAKQNVEGSTTLFDAPDFAADAKKQAMAVIGQVNATVYSALADMMDYQQLSASADAAMERRRAVIKRNHEIRIAASNAAATGDWNEFDRLVNSDRNPAVGEPANGGGAGANGIA